MLNLTKTVKAQLNLHKHPQLNWVFDNPANTDV